MKTMRHDTRTNLVKYLYDIYIKNATREYFEQNACKFDVVKIINKFRHNFSPKAFEAWFALSGAVNEMAFSDNRPVAEAKFLNQFNGLVATFTDRELAFWHTEESKVQNVING